MSAPLLLSFAFCSYNSSIMCDVLISSKIKIMMFVSYADAAYNCIILI